MLDRQPSTRRPARGFDRPGVGSDIAYRSLTTHHTGPRIHGIQQSGLLPYSHSMVPGGLDVTSSTTRFTSRTSLVIRVEIRSSTS